LNYFLDYELLYFNCDANTEQKLKKTLQEMAGKPNLDASKVNKVLEYLEKYRNWARDNAESIKRWLDDFQFVS
jgi:hypothetical protein